MTAERSTSRCVGEPVSWLRLERYHDRAVAPADAKVIEDHLAACPACAACLARIRDDEAVPLAALPRPAPDRVAGELPSRVKSGGRVFALRAPGRLAAAVSTLAVAAAVVLGVQSGWWQPELPPVASSAIAAHVKGGSVAFTLVRDDGERFEGRRGSFRDGDRFKVLVTCPPPFGAPFDVAVFDGPTAPGATPTFPLGAAHAVACGNEVPLPGAMRLTGSTEETICVLWNEEGPLDRASASASLTAEGKAHTGAQALCKVLEPAR